MAEPATRARQYRVETAIKVTALASKVARETVRDTLHALGIDEDVIWDACVIASELATNVVKHVPSAEKLRLYVRVNQECIAVEVWDPSPEPPVPKDDPTGKSGRGLKEVVPGLSTAWYYRLISKDPGGGKIVGARLDRTASRPGDG